MHDQTTRSSARSSADHSADRLLVIIPAYNEAINIPEVVRRVQASIPGADVCVVDDGSTDLTADAASQAGAIALRLPFNMGVGAATQTGFMYAHHHEYTTVARIDGDGQHPPELIPDLVTALHGDTVDIVIGSRFLREEADQAGYRGTLPRRIGIRMLSAVIKLTTGQDVTDPTSGFLVANATAIKFLAGEYPHDYPEPETPVLLHRADIQFKEVPVTMYDRIGGTSHITTARSVYYMFKVMLAVILDSLRAPYRPD